MPLKNDFLWDCGNCVGSHKERTTIVMPLVFNKAHQEKDAGKVSAHVKINADAFIFLLVLYILLLLIFCLVICIEVVSIFHTFPYCSVKLEQPALKKMA